MYWFLLKKALPFTLTFVFGAALSGLLGLFGASEKRAEYAFSTRTYEFGSRCRMRRHNLVAESKPLEIIFKPYVAYYSHGPEGRVWVNVTFGADGRVKEVTPLRRLVSGRGESLVEVKETWEAVESSARRIEFKPEMVNGVPVTVTREVEMEIRSGAN